MESIDEMPCVSDERNTEVKFQTAIVTYPSDFCGQLTLGMIAEFFDGMYNHPTLSTRRKKRTPKVKIVFAREDADEQIQRDHFHGYLDSDEQLKVYPASTYDIPLPAPVVVFVHNDEKKTREYEFLHVLESQLGWDNNTEMVNLLAKYTEEHGFIEYNILHTAHPNIKVKNRKYRTSKCLMLRYVIKEKLVARSTFDVDKELKYLEKEREHLELQREQLIQDQILKEFNCHCIEELIELCKDLKKQLKRQKSKINNQKVIEFREWLRKLVISERMTIKEVMEEIKRDYDKWQIYCSNTTNYRLLINDMFKTAPPKKPMVKWDRKYIVPKKLYQVIERFNDWTRRFITGEELESRPRGLVLIGVSRLGKTACMTSIGPFTYISQMWNMDNWQGQTALNIIDDIDPDGENGIPFKLYKPFFGAQEVITATDKYRGKRDLYNNKPLIWLNNYTLEETFKDKKAIDYIHKNMDVIYLEDHQDLKYFEGQALPEWIEGHTDYVIFDPKQTWYYQNVIAKEEEKKEESLLIEEFEDELDDQEPLSDRKRRLEDEKGRPSKSIRRENSSSPINSESEGDAIEPIRSGE